MATNLKIDASDFIQKALAAGGVKDQILHRARNGLAKAGLQLLNDSVMEIPAVPIKTGHLRASGSVIVEGKATMTTEQMGFTSKGKPGTPATEADDVGPLQAAVAFNTSYAARLHEHPEYHFTDPGTGGKYLEAKLDKHGKEFGEFIANEIAGTNT